MIITAFSILVATTLATITFIASAVLTTRSSADREKRAPFECGFDPKNLSRIPFSIRFFLLALIFLVFDIEIVLLIPLPLISHSTHLPYPLLAGFIFLIILLVGLLHE